MSSDEKGILAYDLASNWCEECGRAKMNRLLGMLTGCKTCDEVITRHRCTGRPDLDPLDTGALWTCQDCGTVWVVTEEAAWCPECGCSECRTEKRWTVSVPGDRIDTAPRHKPQPFTPLRVPSFSPPPHIPFGVTLPHTSCYKTASGIMVHVKPGCRC